MKNKKLNEIGLKLKLPKIQKNNGKPSPRAIALASVEREFNPESLKVRAYHHFFELTPKDSPFLMREYSNEQLNSSSMKTGNQISIHNTLTPKPPLTMKQKKEFSRNHKLIGVTEKGRTKSNDFHNRSFQSDQKNLPHKQINARNSGHRRSKTVQKLRKEERNFNKYLRAPFELYTNNDSEEINSAYGNYKKLSKITPKSTTQKDKRLSKLRGQLKAENTNFLTIQGENQREINNLISLNAKILKTIEGGNSKEHLRRNTTTKSKRNSSKNLNKTFSLSKNPSQKHKLPKKLLPMELKIKTPSNHTQKNSSADEYTEIQPNTHTHHHHHHHHSHTHAYTPQALTKTHYTHHPHPHPPSLPLHSLNYSHYSFRKPPLPITQHSPIPTNPSIPINPTLNSITPVSDYHSLNQPYLHIQPEQNRIVQTQNKKYLIIEIAEKKAKIKRLRNKKYKAESDKIEVLRDLATYESNFSIYSNLLPSMNQLAQNVSSHVRAIHTLSITTTYLTNAILNQLQDVDLSASTDSSIYSSDSNKTNQTPRLSLSKSMASISNFNPFRDISRNKPMSKFNKRPSLVFGMQSPRTHGLVLTQQVFYLDISQLRALVQVKVFQKIQEYIISTSNSTKKFFFETHKVFNVSDQLRTDRHGHPKGPVEETKLRLELKEVLRSFYFTIDDHDELILKSMDSAEKEKLKTLIMKHIQGSPWKKTCVLIKEIEKKLKPKKIIRGIVETAKKKEENESRNESEVSKLKRIVEEGEEGVKEREEEKEDKEKEEKDGYPNKSSIKLERERRISFLETKRKDLDFEIKILNRSKGVGECFGVCIHGIELKRITSQFLTQHLQLIISDSNPTPKQNSPNKRKLVFCTLI
jgi:hypothetical protein